MGAGASSVDIDLIGYKPAINRNGSVKISLMEKINEEEELEKMADTKKSENVEKSFSLKSRGHTWMCAVDGSDNSKDCFRTMMNLRKRLDVVFIFHAYSSDSENIESKPWEKPIRDFFETELLKSLSPNQFSFIWEDLRGRTLRETLVDVLFEYQNLDSTQARAVGKVKPDYLLFGYSGHNFTANGMDERRLGSVADLAMRSVHLPSFIIKKSCPEGPKSYIIAVNNSELAKKGLTILLSMVNRADCLICLYVSKTIQNALSDTHTSEEPKDSESGNKKKKGNIHFDTGDGKEDGDEAERMAVLKSKRDAEVEKMKDYYEQLLYMSGPDNSEFVSLETDTHVLSVADKIIDFVNSSNADFFAIAPRSSQELGSITERAIRRVQSSIILCKYFQ